MDGRTDARRHVRGQLEFQQKESQRALSPFREAAKAASRFFARSVIFLNFMGKTAMM